MIDRSLVDEHRREEIALSLSPSSSEVVVNEACGPGALDSHAPQLDELADRLGVPLTGRRPWLSAWTTAHPHYMPWVTIALDADRPVGAVLLAQRQLGPAIEITSIGHGRNDRSRPMAINADVARLLAARIYDRLRSIRRPWSLLLEQLPVDDPVGIAIYDRMPAAILVPGGAVPGVEFADDRIWGDHISKNLSRQLQKCRNRIVSDGLDMVIAFTRDQREIRAQIDLVEEIHRARDHEVGRPSDIDDLSGRRLWRELVEVHVARNEVELATLRIDGELAAYVVSFVDDDTYRVFDGRFRTKWSRYSPGRILEVEMLRRTCSDRAFRRVDWMNSIAPGKLISANTFEPTMNLLASSEGS
jgi:CelD/BcsL family acetyltransferase involved in cellulose biosynthesis